MRSHRVTEIFSYSHWVTEIFSLRSQGHGGFWQVTNCDPGRSRDYCVYVNDHPLRYHTARLVYHTRTKLGESGGMPPPPPPQEIFGILDVLRSILLLFGTLFYHGKASVIESTVVKESKSKVAAVQSDS